mgnify:CR=1 FL=1
MDIIFKDEKMSCMVVKIAVQYSTIIVKNLEESYGIIKKLKYHLEI